MTYNKSTEIELRFGKNENILPKRAAISFEISIDNESHNIRTLNRPGGTGTGTMQTRNPFVPDT
jgi:hypothetical protein